MSKKVVLITGAGGQIGTELSASLATKGYLVIATDIRPLSINFSTDVIFETLNILELDQLRHLIQKHKVNQIYHLAAVLSATGEQFPKKAWDININGLLSVLDVSVEMNIERVFYPSTIAVFGTTTPALQTPQYTITEPSTVYGISKLAGERWCEYYNLKHGLDVRSLRYPGLISYKTKAGGGTTDYAVDIFFEAIQKGSYTCFLEESTRLPMMYMNDAIRGTIELMEANKETLTVQSSYNFSSLSFTPAELADAIAKVLPNFEIQYKPDFRQQIAATWPQSIDDAIARKDWGWKHDFELENMVKDMIANIKTMQPISC